MFLTLELLEEYNACVEGKLWFSRYFPNGGELIDVIQHKYVTPEVLHWGYQKLTTTPEEREIYWSKLAVDVPNRASIYESDHITNCEYVTRSSNIINSNFVFSCKEVEDSKDVLTSSSVKRSNQVYGSEFVYDSSRVLQSRNITQCSNVINSDYAIRAHSVMNAAVVTDSCYVSGFVGGRTKNIKNSAFIHECVNMKNCLFCFDKHDGEYLLFNEPIDAGMFDMIMNQLKDILGNYQPVFARVWSTETIPLDTPIINRNVITQYSELPEKFWRWVVTLPNYNPTVLYGIIFQPRLLD